MSLVYTRGCILTVVSSIIVSYEWLPISIKYTNISSGGISDFLQVHMMHNVFTPLAICWLERVFPLRQIKHFFSSTGGEQGFNVDSPFIRFFFLLLFYWVCSYFSCYLLAWVTHPEQEPADGCCEAVWKDYRCEHKQS